RNAPADASWAPVRALSYLGARVPDPCFPNWDYSPPPPPFIAPAPYNPFYDPAEVPAPIRAASPEVEAQQHPLLAHYIQSVKQSQFFQDGQGLGSTMSETEVRRMPTAYYGLISAVHDHLRPALRYLR